ncbi:MAG: hypothetical protein QNJ82_17020 [Gammaproteobacteria bacterium]|nr:hypothetical protein [Gammaproteobacteria bacterium]
MKHHPESNIPYSASLGLMAGTLLLLAPGTAFSIDPCEELRRDCMDYCRYQNPMLDHRDCKRECRDRVRDCRGGGMAGPMGFPGSRERSESAEPDFRGMPDVGRYRGGAPGYGAPPAAGYGYPGGRYPQAGYAAPGAAPRPQSAAQAPIAPAQPAVPPQGQAAAAPAPASQPPAQPAVPQYPGYGYPPAGGYGGYPPAAYGYPGYGRPY